MDKGKTFSFPLPPSSHFRPSPPPPLARGPAAPALSPPRSGPRGGLAGLPAQLALRPSRPSRPPRSPRHARCAYG
jgi:hypothetical protein